MRRPSLIVLSLLCVLCACQTGSGSIGETAPIAPSQKPTPSVTPLKSKPAAIGTGILLESWASSQTTGALDQTDRIKNQQTETRAFTAQIGQLVTWNNPDTKNSGTVSPLRDSYSSGGAYCRDFQQTITIGGQQKQAYPKACQNVDGSWKVTK